MDRILISWHWLRTAEATGIEAERSAFDKINWVSASNEGTKSHPEGQTVRVHYRVPTLRYGRLQQGYPHAFTAATRLRTEKLPKTARSATLGGLPRCSSRIRTPLPSILHRLRHVSLLDRLAPLQVRQRPRDAPHTIEASGGEAERPARVLKKSPAIQGDLGREVPIVLPDREIFEDQYIQHGLRRLPRTQLPEPVRQCARPVLLEGEHLNPRFSADPAQKGSSTGTP